MKIRLNMENGASMRSFQSEMINAMDYFKLSMLITEHDDLEISKSLFSDRISTKISNLSSFESTKYPIRRIYTRKLYDAILDCSKEENDVNLFFTMGIDNGSSATFEEAKAVVKAMNMSSQTIFIAFGSYPAFELGRSLGFRQIMFADAKKDILLSVLANTLTSLIKK